MKTFRCIPLALALIAGASAQAAPVIAENFESGLSSTVWTTNSHGVVVADPLGTGNRVLKFSGVQGGGDLWSLDVGAAGTYTLSFDVLGTCGSGNCGAFIGINDTNGEHWLAGDASYGTPHLLQTTGTWQHMSFTFTASSAFRLKMEDYGSFDGIAGDAYFDNVCVSSANSCSVPTANGVPEPGSLALAGLALAGLGLARRRRG